MKYLSIVHRTYLLFEMDDTQREIFPYARTTHSKAVKDKGLSELVRLCFGKSLNKSEQCSNWERRPLRDAQRCYAGTSHC
jgi:hypothetical protein